MMGEVIPDTPTTLTTDILAQNALGLFHCSLQTKYWLLEECEGGCLSS